MPLVFSTSTNTKSGILYDDRTGESYEYPPTYRRLITPGESFIYYRGGAYNYFGSGVIGEVTASAATPGRLVCEILDYSEFDELVPLKDPSGAYYEDVKGRPNFRQGVRQIDAVRFDRIIGAGARGDAPGATREPTAEVPKHRVAAGIPLGGGYATSAVRAAVDDYAVKVAVDEIERRYPGQVITLMPHNNPGFDVRVGQPAQPIRFVEIKGTQSSEPVFFLTEGERQFSISYGAAFSLIVIRGIDLNAGSHGEVTWRDGPLVGPDLTLRARQWQGTLT